MGFWGYFAPPPWSPADDYDGEGDIAMKERCWARHHTGEWAQSGCGKTAIGALGLCAEHTREIVGEKVREERDDETALSGNRSRLLAQPDQDRADGGTLVGVSVLSSDVQDLGPGEPDATGKASGQRGRSTPEGGG